MLDFLFNKKYTDPTNLAKYQDSILVRPGLNREDVDGYISELHKYDILFNGFFGFNAIAENNLFIRQQLILAVMYYIKKDNEACKEAKKKADATLANLRVHLFYMEGYSYFLYVMMAYEFYFKFVPEFAYGNVSLNLLLTMKGMYANISGPDGSVLTTDTRSENKITNTDRLGFSNELYSVYYMNNQTTFVFINHNKHINRLAKNHHINFEFGHFCLFNQNKWLILHPFYPGYKDKMDTPLKESWNNNVISNGINTKEPYWRVLPKMDLVHEKISNVHKFKIGNKITRKIEILRNGIFVTDNGGDFSSFNLANDCKFNYTGKAVEKVGYHSPGNGKVETHKRLELSGDNRIFWMEF